MSKAPSQLWSRVRPIFARALETPPVHRAALLEELCDDEVRSEVEALLAADERASDFLDGSAERYLALLEEEVAAGQPTPLEEPPRALEGRQIGPYRVSRHIGGGGMGIVYRGVDTRLGRKVALKFLPPQWSWDPYAKERLVREARAASALDHPNICPIYDLGEGPDGRLFIVMAYYPGTTLQRRIDEGPLAVEEAVGFVVQIARGLGEAHRAGIVHRDIKPANVMVTDRGVAKIVDFGIAKQADGILTSSSGSVRGTPAYMSPEQLRGGEVDQRSDVWSLGVVLYEALCGRLPFNDAHSTLSVEAEPMSQLRAELPAELDRVASRALDKDPSLRYQSAAELAADLLAAVPAAGAAPVDPRPGASVATALRSRSATATSTSSAGRGNPRKLLVVATLLVTAALVVLAGPVLWPWSDPEREPPGGPPDGSRAETRIVVLPFTNLGPREEDFLAVGMTEEITSGLATATGLGVVSNSSALAYGASDLPVAQIGAELDVQYLLEGSVRWQPHPGGGSERIRVVPRLVSVADDTTVWTRHYDHEPEAIFEVQSQITRDVIDQLEQLGVELPSFRRERLDERPTENLDAYHAYLRGRVLKQRVDNQLRDRILAADSFERAVELDPGFAAAWAGLAHESAFVYRNSFLAPTERSELLERARRAIARARELAPESSATLIALIYVHRTTGEHDLALEAYRRARELYPSDPDVLEQGGYLLRALGRWEESAGAFLQATALDPRDAMALAQLITYTLVPMRRFEQAMELSNRLVAMVPEQRHPYHVQAYIHWLWTGDTGRARQLLEVIAPTDDHFEQLVWLHQEVYEGRNRRALERLDAIDDAWIWGGSLGHWPRALLQALLLELAGEPELARAAYQEALALLESERANESTRTEVVLKLAFVHAGLGQLEEAEAVCERARGLLADADASYRSTARPQLARVYLRLGRPEAALDELEAMLAGTAHMTPALLALEPWWRPLHDHPRFRALIAR